MQFYKTSHTSSSCRKSIISLFNANKSYVVGQSESKDNSFESFRLTLRLVMRHFQKELDFFLLGEGELRGEDILSIILSIIYIKLPGI